MAARRRLGWVILAEIQHAAPLRGGALGQGWVQGGGSSVWAGAVWEGILVRSQAGSAARGRQS